MAAKLAASHGPQLLLLFVERKKSGLFCSLAEAMASSIWFGIKTPLGYLNPAKAVWISNIESKTSDFIM
jgi:hypothetical protein